LVSAVAAATLLLVGCTSDGSAAGPNTAPETAADIEILTTVLGASEIDQAADSQGAFALDDLGQTTESTSRAPTPTSQTSAPSTDPTSSSSTPDQVAVTTTLPAATTTTVVVPTSAAPSVLPPWSVGLINTEGSSQGSFEEYRGGVEAAISWRNAELAAAGRRLVEVSSCSSSDAASASLCAQSFVTGFDGVVSGVDLFSDITLPIVQGAGVPILGGYAITSGDANATNALFDVGGLPAVFAAMSSAAVAGGPSGVAVFYDDTPSAVDLVANFVSPALVGAGIEIELISLPLGTVDVTAAVSQAILVESDSWIVLTSTASCVPIALAQQAAGATQPTVWSPTCNDADLLLQIDDYAAEPLVAFEIAEAQLVEATGAALAQQLDFANLVLGQSNPDLVDDPMALRGWVTGMRVVDVLDQIGPDVAQARTIVAPHLLSFGQFDCGQSELSLCAADIMFFDLVDGQPFGPPAMFNGIA